MQIELQPDTISRDENAMAVRVGFAFDGRLVGVPVTDEYLEDRFRISFASAERYMELARGDLDRIGAIVRAKAGRGTAPDDIRVTTTDS